MLSQNDEYTKEMEGGLATRGYLSVVINSHTEREILRIRDIMLDAARSVTEDPTKEVENTESAKANASAFPN